MNNTISFPKLGLEFDISSVAFTIGGFEIYWYGVFITFGLVLALLYAFRNSKRFGVDSDRMIDVVLGGLVGGVVGARLFYVIFRWSTYEDNLMSIFAIRDGGLAIWGGIIGAFLVGILMCKWRKVKALPMFDIAGLGFLIGQGLGRWGNFFNVEVYGGNTTLPWGMTSPSIQAELAANASKLEELGMTIDPTQPVHPTFLYESLWCIIGFVLLHLYSKRRKFDGEVLLMYLTWYGIGRFVIEGIRTDTLLLGPFRVAQLISALAVVISIALMIYMRRRIKKLDGYTLYVNSDEWQNYLETSDKNKKNDDEPEKEVEPEKEAEQDKDSIEEPQHESEGIDQDQTEEKSPSQDDSIEENNKPEQDQTEEQIHKQQEDADAQEPSEDDQIENSEPEQDQTGNQKNVQQKQDDEQESILDNQIEKPEQGEIDELSKKLLDKIDKLKEQTQNTKEEGLDESED